MNKFKYVMLVSAICSLIGCANKGYNETSAHDAMSIVMKNAFYQAALSKNTALIQKYLNLGYSIDVIDDYSMTALCEAKKDGEDEAYDILYRYGANDKVNCMNFD